jgi:hypothetical protein
MSLKKHGDTLPHQPEGVVVVIRNVCKTLLNFSGYWYINPCSPPLICTSQDPGIFCTIIKELAEGTETSSVPVITNVGMDTLGS